MFHENDLETDGEESNEITAQAAGAASHTLVVSTAGASWPQISIE